METNHTFYTRPTGPKERPVCLPRLSADDFCKAKYSYMDKRCYTARMMDVFLKEECPYVAAYKEFRLKSMDYMYQHHQEDHASTGEQRANGWNAVAESLGYKLVPMEEYVASLKVAPAPRGCAVSSAFSAAYGRQAEEGQDIYAQIVTV